MTNPSEISYTLYDLVVKGGTIVSDSTVFSADVAVDGERIVALGHDLHGRHEFDATRLYVIPGGI